MENSLRDILSSKKKELEEQQPKWDQRKKEWLQDIERLYSGIEGWLSDLIKDKFISIRYDKTTISEELLGAYEVDVLRIIFFNGQTVTLTPKGLYVIGAAGRIDIKIGSEVIMLVRTGDNLQWTFAKREGRGKPKRWEFNETTFKELLTEFAEEF
jgi:hypothetical protein